MGFNRRSFLKGITAISAAAAGGCISSFNVPTAHRRKPGEKLNMGFIGCGGKGWSDWLAFHNHGENTVALCDVDTRLFAKILAKIKEDGGDSSKIKLYQDYRKMLEENPHLDAVTVSTPDHMHAIQAITAMELGINVYVQKPLVRTLWEVERFDKTARRCGVITQMGNQGSSGKGHRRNVELLQQGVLGDVTEVHVWTNRPIWPQGLKAKQAAARPADPIPPELDWDLWIGTAAPRDFKLRYSEGDGYGWKLGVYHQFCWRGFRDFGTGAFGDMACHTMNLPFRGLELGRVTKAVCRQAVEANDVAYPVKSIVEVTYAARKSRVRKGVTLPEVKLFWYDGNQQPKAELMPQVVATLGAVPKTGCLIIGTKGIMCSTNDYGQEAYIAMKGDAKVKSSFKHEACTGIASYIPVRSEKGQDGQQPEFADAIKGIGPVLEQTHSRCFSDIEHSIPMLEGMLVGCVAQQIPDREHLWDADNRIFDSAAANALVKPYIRSGWEF
ncbi:MAG: Gfo/Idh/MocA family oxidoreductase [Kiritimatiellae bacterium]|nr:Gfo/Idh/MocA family oxidoreductase [Kiritimatiellia bacterium]